MKASFLLNWKNLLFSFFLFGHRLLGFSGGSDGKESACSAGDLLGFSPWVGEISWRREWQPTPVFLPAESHGQSSLLGNSPWDYKEVYMTEQLTHILAGSWFPDQGWNLGRGSESAKS